MKSFVIEDKNGLFCIVNIQIANDQATQGARTSAAMVLILLLNSVSQNTVA